jgi:hypothetical protein
MFCNVLKCTAMFCSIEQILQVMLNSGKLSSLSFNDLYCNFHLPRDEGGLQVLNFNPELA